MATPFVLNVDFSPNDEVFGIVGDENNSSTHCVKKGIVKAVITTTLTSGTVIEYQIQFEGDPSVTILDSNVYGNINDAITAYELLF